jgi:hypothetical protein
MGFERNTGWMSAAGERGMVKLNGQMEWLKGMVKWNGQMEWSNGMVKWNAAVK